MDKNKFVLNHKIQLLENEIEPKDNKIGEMKQQILAMEEELTAVVKDQATIKTIDCHYNALLYVICPFIIAIDWHVSF